MAGLGGLGNFGATRQPAGRQVGQRTMLGGNQRRHQAQEAFELVSGRQSRQPRCAPGEDRCQIGQADPFTLDDIAQGVLAEPAGGRYRCLGQGLPTSCRNHLRWCFQLQPRVTDPRVMARNVPLTQMAA